MNDDEDYGFIPLIDLFMIMIICLFLVIALMKVEAKKAKGT